MTHSDPPTMPVAIGGSANESQVSTETSSVATEPTERTLIPVAAVDRKRGLVDYEFLEARSAAPVPTSPPLARRHLRRRRQLNRLAVDDLD